MIMTQKFHSAKEIDPEFITPIQDLLKNEIPSFDWILFAEENAPQSIHFTYYLFFGGNHNSPIGFSRALIENKESEPGFLTKFVKTTKKTKHLQWKIPGVSNEGIIIDPLYIKDALTKANSIIQEYNVRKDIMSQRLRLDSMNAGVLGIKQASSHKVINGLLKNQSSYQDYFESLTSPIQKTIKMLWKQLYQNKDFTIQSYNSIKEAFAYKDDGAQKLKELKEHKFYKLYSKEIFKTITLENAGTIEAIVFLFKGNRGYLFSDFFKFNDQIDTDLLIQVAIMNFYEEEEFNTLHFLRGQREVSRFIDLGFRVKSQTMLLLKDHA